MSEALSEEQLIEQAVQGDNQALHRLLRLHWRRIEGYVRERLPQPLRGQFEPRDILQDVFQLAIGSFCSFKPEGDDAVFRWFIAIARNRMAELLRAQMTAKRGGRRQGFGKLGDLSTLLEQLAVSYRTPSQSAIRHELAQVLETCLDQLPADYRQAIRLRYFGALSFQQIAVQMNRSEGSAQMLCNRGLRRLRTAMISASRYA
jgi:RNA polymerase sigma-70 factor (ECF subfamily)